MSSSSSSSSSPSSSPSSRPRSSWLQVVLFTLLVYILIFSTACCQAVPVWKTSPQQLKSMSTSKLDDDAVSVGGGAGIPSLPIGEGEFDSPDSILERCLQATDGELEENLFVKTLCTLALMHTRHANGKTNHQGYVKRGVSSDRSSFSAFNRFVSRLRLHANEVADYQEKLNRMQALGVLDSDYNVISVPSETASLMRQLG
ncbi:uncharacterized protein LOC100893023 [Strongylocentrotus purpuratus]|uniref:Uncharacterized protein n=1 Tax=Strongylocentrotus purpuratus TaxID=7668 RepID=A0A7M7GMK1_STRPU|nr:uncharacterized protein LOC100893023 [Strongylocentrotus purpuratus]